MAIATIGSRVDASLSFLGKAGSMYIALGKTTPWENEKQPPDEDPNLTALQEVIGYKKASKVSLCRPFVEGETTSLPTIEYGKQKFVLVPIGEAFTEKATQVYIEVTINDDDLPLGTYRQVGLHTGLKPKSGVTKDAIIPSQVQDAGVLQVVDNREQQNRVKGLTVKERLIVTMSNLKEV